MDVVVETALDVSNLVWFNNFNLHFCFVCSSLVHKQKFEVEGSKFGVTPRSVTKQAGVAPSLCTYPRKNMGDRTRTSPQPTAKHFPLEVKSQWRRRLAGGW